MEELNLWLYGIIKDVADGRVFPDHIPLQNNPSDDAHSHDYLSSLTEESPFSAEVFSRTVYPEAPEDLQQYMNREEYQIPDGFTPDKRTVSTLNMVTFTENSYTLKVRRDAIISGNAYYDADQDAVILKNPSDRMKAELTIPNNDDDSPEN